MALSAPSQEPKSKSTESDHSQEAVQHLPKYVMAILCTGVPQELTFSRQNFPGSFVASERNQNAKQPVLKATTEVF